MQVILAFTTGQGELKKWATRHKKQLKKKMILVSLLAPKGKEGLR